METTIKSQLPKISIIVPFKNAEQTIGRCLESILRQTYSHIEVIAVDDGSIDNSLNIASKYKHKFIQSNKTMVILQHEFCQGVTMSRQHALEVASGDYIGACDADDWFDIDMIEKLVRPIHKNKELDLVTCGYKLHIGKNVTNILYDNTVFPNINKTPLDTLHFSLCNKLIRREKLKSIEFFEGIDCWDDLNRVARILMQECNMYIINEPLYNYFRPVSDVTLTTSSKHKILTDHIKCAIMMEDWLKRHDLLNTNSMFLKHLKFAAKIKYLRGQHKSLKKWYNTFPEVNNEILFYSIFPMRYRILFNLANKLAKIRGLFDRQ